ncbi:MAG: Na+/H+ antiporter [Flavobacteriales bacterium]|nr:Na+/H+ antiporter [Flavobacteriales bacterium]
MHQDILLVLGLLFAVSLLTLLSPKLRIAYPILLVIGGLLIAFVPGIPHVHIDPELIFLIFLPPLLYEAAWFTNWHQFWKWRRSISMLAFGLVFLTSLVVGLFTSWMIPGFTLAMGFLLGGIISPPDAVAATSVLKGLPIPKRATTLLEGESLVNDASSLIVFRFALVAVLTGQFSMGEAVGQFFLLALGGIAVGLALAHVMYFAHKLLPTTPSIDTAMTLMSPYLMYIIAEEFHTSGVLSVVSGGLFLSYRSHAFLDHKARIQAYSVWSTLIFMLNGLVFILIGLDLPDIVAGLGHGELRSAILYGLLVSAVVIAVRFGWMYVGTWLARLLFRGDLERTPAGDFRLATVLGWAGMRGVVSLASALSIPHLLDTGEPFPMRGTILVMTFVVILVTLVGQGLTLPWLVRRLKLVEVDHHLPEEEQELILRKRMVHAVVDRLSAIPERDTKIQEVLDHFAELETTYIRELEDIQRAEGSPSEKNSIAERELLGMVMAAQRGALLKARSERTFDHELLRKMESKLDLEQARLNN